VDKILTVAAREFVETVKTRAFLLGVVLMPAIIFLAASGAEWFRRAAEKEEIATRTIAIVDESGVLLPSLTEQIAKYNEENPHRLFELKPLPPADANFAQLREQTRNGQLYAYLLIPPDVLAGTTPAELGRRDAQLESGRQIRNMLNEAVWGVRMRDAAMDAATVRRLLLPVGISNVDVRTGAEGEDNEIARAITPFVFMMLLFMATFSIAWGLLTTVIEEKSSRVVEVLLSAISPTQLMAGKILGMVGVGVVLLTVWGAAGVFAARAQGVGHVVSVARLAYFVAYFVPGFLLFSAILGAIGSACNTLKEAQSMVSPLSLLNIVPLVFWMPISQNPNSAFSVALSFVPPITPFVMVLRLCADPELPFWQILSTQALLWAAVVAMIWAAGKVFRVGVLMYGKAPSIRELVRWVRYA